LKDRKIQESETSFAARGQNGHGSVYVNNPQVLKNLLVTRILDFLYFVRSFYNVTENNTLIEIFDLDLSRIHLHNVSKYTLMF